MTLKTIRGLRDTALFKPFELHLTSGRTLVVSTADHVFLNPEVEELLVVQRGGEFSFVDPAQIQSINRVGTPGAN